jgi:mRNA interferase YafQ
MYYIVFSKEYKKSLKKLKESGTLKAKIVSDLEEAIDTIASGHRLPIEYRDHQLTGELKEYRECHIKGDLLLQYQLRKNELILILVDIGTHSYLF